MRHPFGPVPADRPVVKSAPVTSDNLSMDPAGTSPRNAVGDQGSIVVGWLTRLTLVLGLLGLVGFEVLSIAVARVSLEDYGKEAAQEAIHTYQNTHNPTLAYQSAVSVADEHGARIAKKSFTVTPDGAVSFTISNTATTLVLYRVDRLASLAKVRTTIYQEPIEDGGTLQ